MSLLQALQVALSWYLVLAVIGLAVYPWLLTICEGLYDRGWSLFRAVGVAVFVLPIWVVGNVTSVPFNTPLLIVTGLLIGLPGWWLAIRRWNLIQFVRQRWRYLVLFEIATATLFFGYILFRGFNPDIQGTEKPMELAFLNAAIHSGEIPVPDPWFAGESVNYYYFGYVALAAVAMLAGTPGEVAFILGLATSFALATVAAGGLAVNLIVAMDGYHRVRVVAAGVLGGFLLSIGANLHTASELVRRPSETINAGWWDGVGWTSSRVIEDTGFRDGSSRSVITEFPAFSWILGDLHPHVIAYPWLIAAVALVVNLFLLVHRQVGIWTTLTRGASVGVALGVLYASNTWDVPTVVAILAGAMLLLLRTAPVQQVVLAGAGTIAAFLLSALPFIVRYDAPTVESESGQHAGVHQLPVLGALTNAIGFVRWDRTSTGELITHWGAFLMLATVVLAIVYGANKSLVPASKLLFTGTPLVLAIVAFILSTPAILLLGLPALLFFNVALRTFTDSAKSLVAAMISIALLILIAIEFVFIRDPFGDRMNTVFKFSFQMWAVLAIAFSALIPVGLARIRQQGSRVYFDLSVAIVGAIVLIMSIYSPLSGYRWSEDMGNWRGIDGLGYIDRARPGERQAFEWLAENRDSIGVIVEAPGCAYGSDNSIPHSRVSMATGIPTIIGWDGHQRQWRRGQFHHLAEIGPRIDNTRLLYEAFPDHVSVAQTFGVTHVFVGAHEVDGYRQCGHGPPYEIPDRDALEDIGWELEFSKGDVLIYRVL